MRQIEFDTELQGKPFLAIPQEVAAQLPKSGHAKVIILLSENAEDLRRCASRALRWHRPTYCDRHGCGSPDGRVDRSARLDSLRCRADSRERLVAQRPCTKTDPSTKTL